MPRAGRAGGAALLGVLTAPAIAESDRSGERVVIARRPLLADGSTTLILSRDRSGHATLIRLGPDDAAVELACGPFEGAWGLWVEDVDEDGRVEVIVALRKKARFDPVLENRLHVYALKADRCVPMWRGTRLAGRFDEVNVDGSKLFSLERVGRGRRRIARYRWTGFGYAVDRLLWTGTDKPPAKMIRRLGL